MSIAVATTPHDPAVEPIVTPDVLLDGRPTDELFAHRLSSTGPLDQRSARLLLKRYANEAVTSMAEANVTWQGNTLTMTADTGSGLGVESTLGVGSPYGGGALNGRRLDVTSGLASLDAWIEDWEAVGTSHLAIVGASLTPLPSPGLPALGGNLLVLPDGVFNATSGVWQGVVIASSDVVSGGSDAVFDGGEFASTQISLSSTLPDGIALYSQGAIFDLTTVTLDSTNVARTTISSL